MRNSNEQSLGEIIRQMIDQYRLRDKLSEVAVRHTWDLTMGQAVSKRTESIRVEKDKMIIRITSASLKQELSYQKDSILELMNRELGGDYIKEVVIQ
jgi:ATP-dependent Zn protease